MYEDTWHHTPDDVKEQGTRRETAAATWARSDRVERVVEWVWPVSSEMDEKGTRTTTNCQFSSLPSLSFLVFSFVYGDTKLLVVAVDTVTPSRHGSSAVDADESVRR